MSRSSCEGKASFSATGVGAAPALEEEAAAALEATGAAAAQGDAGRPPAESGGAATRVGGAVTGALYSPDARELGFCSTGRSKAAAIKPVAVACSAEA